MKCRLAFLAVMLLASLLFCVSAVAEDDARMLIAAAEDRVQECYRAIAEADEAGANTTALLAVLEESGWLLSKARLAYDVGDLNSAVDFANQSRELLKGFVDEADLLREEALQLGYWDFMFNVVGSVVGAVVVVFGGFVVWILLKRKYGEAVVL